MAQAPNILFIVGEHFNGCIDPALPPKPLELPHLGSLAAQGTRFLRAYCNSPVCGPSRMSFFSGLMPCHNETYDNGSILPSHFPTMAHFLAAHGYRTAISGRMHMHGLDPYRGFEERLASEILNPLPTQKACFPDANPDVPELPDGTSPLWNPADSALYRHDRFVTDCACRYLQERGSDRERPFFLLAGYQAAHPSGRANPEYRDWYEKYLADPDLPLPKFDDEKYGQLPRNARRQLAGLGLRRDIFDSEYHRKQMAIYFAGLSFLDQQVGRLLQSLEEAGLQENTVVCFIGDHGENMGRHGLWGKMNFYEESVRVPLLVSGPDIQSENAVQTPVSLVDLLPTFLDLAGIAAEVPLDGRSLRPELKGETAESSKDVWSEYHGYKSASGGYMLLRENWKYIHYPGDEDELYDHGNDPEEDFNLASDPNHTERAGLMRKAIQEWFGVEELEERIRIHNLRRDATWRGVYESAITRQRLGNEIAEYREALNEPWFDGGDFIANQEWFLNEPPSARQTS